MENREGIKIELNVERKPLQIGVENFYELKLKFNITHK